MSSSAFVTTPSITYNGLLEALIEPTPRMLISAIDPGSPVAEAVRTPAILPDNALSKDSLEPETILSALMTAADPVNEDFFAVP